MDWLGLLAQLGAIVLAIIAFPLHIVWVLISSLFGFIFILLSPFIYMFSFFYGIARGITNFFISLEPLYVFVTCGAIIGVFAGVSLAITSGALASALGITSTPGKPPSSKQDYSEDDESTPTTPTSPFSSSTPGGRRSSSFKLEDAPGDIDWYFLDTTPPKRGKRAAGLVAQTIHEEESNDSES